MTKRDIREGFRGKYKHQTWSEKPRWEWGEMRKRVVVSGTPGLCEGPEPGRVGWHGEAPPDAHGGGLS